MDPLEIHTTIRRVSQAIFRAFRGRFACGFVHFVRVSCGGGAADKPSYVVGTVGAVGAVGAVASRGNGPLVVVAGVFGFLSVQCVPTIPQMASFPIYKRYLS